MATKNKSAKERIAIVTLVGVLCLLIIGSSTFARVVKKGETENSITSGEVKVSILNQNSAGEDMPELTTSILPGDTLDNVIRIENTGEHDEFVRVSLDKTIYETSDRESVLNDEYVSFLFNNNDWIYQDGYYYYNGILPAGEISSALYEGIYLDTRMGNEYKKAVMDIEITVEATQSINNGTPLTAEGWTTVFETVDIDESVEISTKIDFNIETTGPDIDITDLTETESEVH